MRLSAANSQLVEFPPEVTDSLPTVEALAERYAALAASKRQAIEAANGQGDADTGDLFTEVLYPAISSHRRIAPEERARLGISDGFIRLSVGIEDPADIISDLDRALERT